ncbi:MAG: polysaccharide deacetylase family protein [Provencibacterium sp.]|jgi:peptidoglycan/xylan/chitin deacetylase (PgdA/CDA1 family)|nr:polysaccharide deacetylase family protein [Provencibacterium sp.]
MIRIPKWLPGSLLGLLAVLLAARFCWGGAQMAGGEAQQAQLPIIMYHHILEKSSLLGDYVITPEQFQTDMEYLKAEGYTTVLPSEVAAYVRGEGELPEKPVMITFDDGNKSTFVYAYPILERLGMKAALAVIGIHSETYSLIEDGNVSYAHATWEELAEMQRSGLIEIGSHTYNLHEESFPRRGTLRKDGESLQDYRKALYEDLSTNQELLLAATGEYPQFFAYPFGFIDPDADEVLDELGFDLTLGVAERVDTVVLGDLQSAKKLGRFNRPYSARTETFFERVFSQIKA